jgi:hypothetical protein
MPEVLLLKLTCLVPIYINFEGGFVIHCFSLLFQVTQLKDFFGSTNVFFAYGNERYSKEDFDLDVEGTVSYTIY